VGRSIKYEAPHCATFSILLLLHSYTVSGKTKDWCHNCKRIWLESLFFSKMAHPQISIVRSLHIYLTVSLWFGRGLIMWTPWSLDLTPLDFCLWGYMKDAVYAPPSNNPTSVTCTDNRCSCISWCRNGMK
jgi:hypothetical protein